MSAVLAVLSVIGLMLAVPALIWLAGSAFILCIGLFVFPFMLPMFARDRQVRGGFPLRRAVAQEAEDMLLDLLELAAAWPILMLRPVVRFISDLVSDR